MTDEQRYKEYLANKRVVLVGPSMGALSQEKGEFIDSCDVVVRLNNMLEIDDKYKKNFGSRTDVVYSTLDDPPKGIALRCINKKVKFLSSSYPSNEWFFSERMATNTSMLKQVKQFSTVVMPSEPYWTIKKENKSRPNTGFCAIIDLLSSDLKELYIIGVDFYRSVSIDSGDAYFADYQCQWSHRKKKDFLNLEYDGHDHHNPDNDFKYFKYKMYLEDSRIKVDPFFKNFLDNKKYDNLSNCFKDE